MIGYRSYGQGKTTIRKYKFKYNKEKDWYVCPETGAILPYTGRVDRNGYKYYSDKKNCEGCAEVEGCCKAQGYRVIRRHIREEWNKNARERRLSERGKDLYKMRKEKIERSFADSKQNYGYRYAMYKGIEKNQNDTWLICAAQNMKNIANKVWRDKKKERKLRKYSINYVILFVYVGRLLMKEKRPEKLYGLCLQFEPLLIAVLFTVNTGLYLGSGKLIVMSEYPKYPRPQHGIIFKV